MLYFISYHSALRKDWATWHIAIVTALIATKKHFQDIAVKFDKSLAAQPRFDKGKAILQLGEAMPDWAHRLAKDALGNYARGAILN